MKVPYHRPETDQDGEKPEGPGGATTQPGHVDGDHGGDHDLLGEQPGTPHRAITVALSGLPRPLLASASMVEAASAKL